SGSGSSSGSSGGVCTPNGTRCTSNDLQTCDGTGNWGTPVPCPFVCSSGACVASCSTGATQCSGLNVQTCTSSGTWQTTQTCPYVCSGTGTCSGTCSPGATGCAALMTPETCDSTGTWVTQASCGSTAICQSGTCVPLPDSGAVDSGPADAGCGALNTAQNCGTCGHACSGACYSHSNAVGGTYYDCSPTGTYSQALATKACASSGHGACAAASTACADGGTDLAMCTSCTLGLTYYCWVYSGPSVGKEFSIVNLLSFTCNACPTGTTNSWN
ncbi:MAG: hypothetical protein ACRENE_20805, partial [Polyangiaceae bacterium]